MNKLAILKTRALLQGKLNPVTTSLLALSALVIVGCDQQKTAIDDSTDHTQSMIEERKDAVAADAADATRRVDVNADIDKANIEAEKVATEAQLDADKIKAGAEGAAEKARVDAVKNQ
jgi:3-hydroxy-3-methylglutaryl CoA synthase